jgi:hypothetical protein
VKNQQENTKKLSSWFDSLRVHILPLRELFHHTNSSMRHTSALVDPFIYPLFFPYGQDGWSYDLVKTDGKKLRRAEYIRYLTRLLDCFNPITEGGRLFQQFVVDQYIRVQSDTLQWVDLNQGRLRAADYDGLNRYLQNLADRR